MIDGLARNIGWKTKDEAKSQAIQWDIRRNIFLGYQRVEIEGDSKMIIDLIQNSKAPLWKIRNVIEENY